MSFAEKMHRASFRGVGFLVASESVSRGKKIVMHEYPNSNLRYVEELGKFPPVFSVEGLVHGADAINQRIRLENVLELPGIGLLVHPVYGELKVKSLEYSVNSSQTNIGVFNFSMQFAQSRENITPLPDDPTETAVSSAAKTLNGKIDDALGKVYKPPTTAYGFQKTVETLQGTFDTVHRQINKVVNLSAQGAATFNRVYRTVTNNITSIVSSANKVRENVALFYAAALDAPVFVQQLGAAWNNLLDYPLIIPTSAPKTRAQQETEQNSAAIVEHMKLTCLTNAYEAGTYTEFTTDTELTAARKFLDDSFKAAYGGDNSDLTAVNLISLADDTEIRKYSSTLKVTARKVFDLKEKAVYRVVGIKPGMSSMALTSYRYYGNLDLINGLVTLNPDISHANFNKLIKALTG